MRKIQINLEQGNKTMKLKRNLHSDATLSDVTRLVDKIVGVFEGIHGRFDSVNVVL